MSAAQRRGVPLLLVLALIMLPLGWLGQVSPAFGQVLNRVFATNDARAAGHTLLFAALGLLLCSYVTALRVRPLRYFALILAAGVGQEAFQLLYKQRPLVADDGTDLLVDLTAAFAAYLLVRAWAHRPGAEDPRTR